MTGMLGIRGLLGVILIVIGRLSVTLLSQQNGDQNSPCIDIGLRVYDGTATIRIACEPEGTLTSPLRIAKNGTIYGIVLVAPSDPHASRMRIQTSSGVRALRKY
jgi:hypothetical protein